MKSLAFFLVLCTSIAHAQFQFVSPVPGSKMLNPDRNIILREGDILNPSSVKQKLFTLQGARSGNHSFKMTLTRDEKTIILDPDAPFDFNEEVTVSINPGLKTKTGKQVRPYSFSFDTHREYTQGELDNFNTCKSTLNQQETGTREETGSQSEAEERDITGAFTIKVNTAPSTGDIFYDAWSNTGATSHFAGYHIITPNGDSIFSSETEGILDCDFEISKRGYLTHMDNALARFEVMDSNYNLIDTYSAVNGYTTDIHEFEYLSDGHAILIADEYQIIDMTAYNPNFDSNATVIGNVMQEFDEDKNLIFEWRSFDHVAIAESEHVNLAFSLIDYIHINSIDVDADGNLIVSNRHLEQINKIDRVTGAFIWRLGGVMNQFSFVNDPDKFSYQHDARHTPDGNYTIWDNGNYHSPVHSMAKKYKLDLSAMTATLVWSYQPKKDNGTDAYFFAMGNVQELSNGNYFINGGQDNSKQSNYWEVTPNGTVVWELALTNTKSLVSYRARKFMWNPCAPVLTSGIHVTDITATTAKVKWNAVNNAVSYDVEYKKISAANYKLKNSTTTSKKLKNLTANKSYEYQVRTHCANGFTSDWSPLDTFITAPQKLYYEDAIQNLSFEITPNPACDQLNIQFNTDEDNPVVITLYDLAGKLVPVSSMTNSTPDGNVHLNLNSLTPGVYIIEVKTAEWREVKKFVKE